VLPDKPPQPWSSFLDEIDGFVTRKTTFHLLGGFVVTILYGSPRTTSDLDALTVTRLEPELIEYAGQGSPLHTKHKIYLDPVGVAQLTENYGERLTEIYTGAYENLRLFVLDPYDIALTKIERNIGRDRDDVKHLARVVPFDLDVLRGRYYDELRVYLGNPEREDLTIKLWTEMIEEERA
jgi:hypothetical protein